MALAGFTFTLIINGLMLVYCLSVVKGVLSTTLLLMHYAAGQLILFLTFSLEKNSYFLPSLFLGKVIDSIMMWSNNANL